MKKVPLHDLHVELGAKIVPFAGYEMPLRYSSDKEEHLCVREKVGVFDVSHMGEFLVKGDGALNFLQWVSSNDVSKLKIGQAQYAYLPNEKGGIVDDFITYRLAENKYLLVVNASNIEKDWNWINQYKNDQVSLENLSDNYCLLAVQGPLASQALQSLTMVDLNAIDFYHFKVETFAGISDVIISATGYTGAGGFELYIPSEFTTKAWVSIFEAGATHGIQPIGLGARDTLRLEMGYCLYGNDINDETSPIDAGLSWVTKFTKEFVGSEIIEARKKMSIQKRLVGIVIEERGIPRKDYMIENMEGDVIGTITSGSMSPSMNKGIALGYVDAPYHKAGSEINIVIRNKKVLARVVKNPIYKK